MLTYGMELYEIVWYIYILDSLLHFKLLKVQELKIRWTNLLRTLLREVLARFSKKMRAKSECVRKLGAPSL